MAHYRAGRFDGVGSRTWKELSATNRPGNKSKAVAAKSKAHSGKNNGIAEYTDMRALIADLMKGFYVATVDGAPTVVKETDPEYSTHNPPPCSMQLLMGAVMYELEKDSIDKRMFEKLLDGNIRRDRAEGYQQMLDSILYLLEATPEQVAKAQTYFDREIERYENNSKKFLADLEDRKNQWRANKLSGREAG